MSKATRRPVVGAALLACVLLVAVVIVAGCGSPTGATKTYTDGNYGFSFDYPSGWEVQQGDSSDVTAGGSAAASVGVYDPEGAVADDTFIDLVQVSVYKLNLKVDESMMDEIKPEVEQVLASLESQATDMKTLEPLSETTVGSMTGFQVTYSFAKGGVPATSTLYFLFWDDMEYQLTVQSATENWEAKKSAFDALVGSFRPRATE